MNDWLIYTIGFTAQILFSGRTIIQWISSEKNKKVTTPSIFWVLSVFASFLLFIYGDLRDDFAIMLGQMITFYIYIRNLHLQGKWTKLPKTLQWVIILLSIGIFIYAFSDGKASLERLFRNDAIPFWLLVLGIIAQIVFTLRFIYQWLYSEKKKVSSLPVGFWILSLVGSLLILIYGIMRKDPVLIAGHLFGIVVYLRNIYLHKNEIKT